MAAGSRFVRAGRHEIQHILCHKNYFSGSVRKLVVVEATGSVVMNAALKGREAVLRLDSFLDCLSQQAAAGRYVCANDRYGSGVEEVVAGVSIFDCGTATVFCVLIKRPTKMPMAKKRAAMTSAPSSNTAGRRSSRLNSANAEWLMPLSARGG